MNKQFLIEEYKDTVEACIKGFYYNNKAEMIKFPVVSDDDNICFDKRYIIDETDEELDSKPMPEIAVVNNDTLSHAKDLVDKGYNVTILNMACNYLPGGGVLKGSSAQEEDLFRRTNLMNFLYRLHPIGKDFGLPVKTNNLFYPIEGKYDLIWSPNVSVFKASSKDYFQYLDLPYNVNVITCAAVRKPTLVNNRLQDYDENVMRIKIRSILACATNTQIPNSAIVLGAFGCGAYGNPPEQIAQIFQEEIQSCPTIKTVDLIHFAIIDSNSVSEKHNPNGNFKPFADIFNKKNNKEND